MEKNNYAVPVAIVIAGLLIAGAMVFGNNGTGKSLFSSKETADTSTQITNLTPVSASDHITGSANPTITVVEYSDLECPYCKIFQQAMTKTLTNNPNVAWVYRHFPLDSLHPKARGEAEAAACVGKLGGNDTFWAYINKIFAITPSNNGLDTTILPKLATDLGIKQADFDACLKNGDGKKIVDTDTSTGTDVQVSGTPFPVLIDTDGRVFTIFDQNFNPDTAKLSPEAKKFVTDLYAQYENIIKAGQ